MPKPTPPIPVDHGIAGRIAAATGGAANLAWWSVIARDERPEFRGFETIQDTRTMYETHTYFATVDGYQPAGQGAFIQGTRVTVDLLSGTQARADRKGLAGEVAGVWPSPLAAITGQESFRLVVRLDSGLPPV